MAISLVIRVCDFCAILTISNNHLSYDKKYSHVRTCEHKNVEFTQLPIELVNGLVIWVR